MRKGQAWAGALMTAALTVAGLSGCQTSSKTDGKWPGQGGRSAQPSGYGAEFLAVDECSSFGTTSFTEVPCTSERAAARVIARYDGPMEQGPPCAATTDFVLNISKSTPAPDTGEAVPQGYACMRNLEPPHPGDPGGGGGPLTIVGDCVYGAGGGEVRETACDGGGAHAPEYKVTSAVAQRSQCPASTALYVQLGGDKPVGCARPV
ncbi:hypothetical protein ABZ904_06905 [Streptomyces sp. NPDC046900]|uniref:hypothetical protein n=1 Tax=Streptomyces sp. NPDC046900 TaxID=3155473 RepID=UPI0033F54E3E